MSDCTKQVANHLNLPSFEVLGVIRHFLTCKRKHETLVSELFCNDNTLKKFIQETEGIEQHTDQQVLEKFAELLNSSRQNADAIHVPQTLPTVNAPVNPMNILPQLIQMPPAAAQVQWIVTSDPISAQHFAQWAGYLTPEHLTRALQYLIQLKQNSCMKSIVSGVIGLPESEEKIDTRYIIRDRMQYPLFPPNVKISFKNPTSGHDVPEEALNDKTTVEGILLMKDHTIQPHEDTLFMDYMWDIRNFFFHFAKIPYAHIEMDTIENRLDRLTQTHGMIGVEDTLRELKDRLVMLATTDKKLPTGFVFEGPPGTGKVGCFTKSMISHKFHTRKDVHFQLFYQRIQHVQHYCPIGSR